MRIMIKGGVWKNTEDEILKAAVMKYGKNQWSRISSLLVRKSAKQCKARWYEWLDPSIKKTEWTREEDEKLLHLAKLMPTQWRTIAPIVGRTPAQCLERYEKLLDSALSKDENYEASDDPRRLRPGEIDPNPESKPARPDPVDMDEDEKEMLSEARARLANTRGKKAKRKAREKQLEEARRLASLQKRRELKAAGLDANHRKRKQRGIDYNAEIPFEKKPPPGFYATAQEGGQSNVPMFPVTVEELEGKRRADVEAQLKRQDVARNKIQQRHDAPAAVLQVNKLNDPAAVRKRSKMMLPAPQVTDRELEEIAKLSYSSELLEGDEGGQGSAATRALLANYDQTPGRGGAAMTPLRTPQRTPAGKGDAIMMEAENLARLRDLKTPLYGGENPDLHASDFSGVTPKKKQLLTPNPIATPLRTPGGTAAGATPGAATPAGMTPGGFGVTPRGTPIRDGLQINEGADGLAGSGHSEKQRLAELRQNLKAGLSGLPAPKNEYAIVVPQLPEDEGEERGDEVEPDAADLAARARAEAEAQEKERLRRRSRALQRGLPRPPLASVERLLTAGNHLSGPLTPVEEAEELVRREVALLLRHDAAKYPPEDTLADRKKKGALANGTPSTLAVPELDSFEEAEILEAAGLVEQEAGHVRRAMGHEDASLDDFIEARSAIYEDLVWLPTKGLYGLASVANTSEYLAGLASEHEAQRQHMEADTKRAVKLEQKLKVLVQGYQMRAQSLWGAVEASFKEAGELGTELECYRELHRQEQVAAPSRIENLQEEVAKQADKERALQLRYENLLVERENLKRLIHDRDAAASEQKKQAEEIAAQSGVDKSTAAAAEGPPPEVSIPQEPADVPTQDAIDGIPDQEKVTMSVQVAAMAASA